MIRWLAIRALVAGRRPHSDLFMTGTNSLYVEQLFDQWKANPASVHASWQAYFAGLEAGKDTAYQAPPSLQEHLRAAQGTRLEEKEVMDTLKVNALVRAYQFYGHLFADLDPLQLDKHVEDHLMKKRIPGSVRIENYNFSETDKDRVFRLGSKLFKGYLSKEGEHQGVWRFRDLLEKLNQVYCNKIGYEYMHIPFRDEINFIRDRIEVDTPHQASPQLKRQLLERLGRSTLLEEYFHTKFATHKRFGLDGLEVVVPALESIIERSVEHGVDTFIIGMPHRGRLNVLVHVLGTPLEEQFAHFFGTHVRKLEEGDVKYHLGRTVERVINGKKVTVTLLANPSHLEAADPVVLGKTRAIQDYQKTKSRAMAILIHGDAALAGQGVIFETGQMEELYGYTTGGTIHVVANNNIGFTTNPKEARSGLYPTEIAKTMSAPVFHVNGDCPEDVDFVSKLAADWRNEFRTDVFLDVIGYRKFGHNETDEPMFTNPLMYKLIRNHTSTFQLYSQKLVREGTMTQEEVNALAAKIGEDFEVAFKKAAHVSEEQVTNKYKTYTEWSPINLPPGDVLNSGVKGERLRELGAKMCALPADLNAHPNITKIYRQREQSLEKGAGIDWATGEALAWASLLTDDKMHVRISGEDVERGTFSHRHAVLHDQVVDRKKYVPLQNLSSSQAEFTAVNSLLSEYGVLGFEYGYSIANPNCLVMWEAQFGDFANGAQIMFDQFIFSSEAKWGQQTGLVMLLPHGYDGQGAEHSCGRMERLLQLSAENPYVLPVEKIKDRNQVLGTNLQLCVPTTPANYFHMLRRQLRREFRKPLVVMSPKRLLRHKGAVSDLADFSTDRVARLIDDPAKHLVGKDSIRKVLFCSGQVYYDLVDEREKRGIKDIAVCRVEQIAPFPFDRVQHMAAKYTKASFHWVQEEPLNLGPWNYVWPRLETCLTPLGVDRVTVVSRAPHAAAATGYPHVHAAELVRLLDQAME